MTRLKPTLQSKLICHLTLGQNYRQDINIGNRVSLKKVIREIYIVGFHKFIYTSRVDINKPLTFYQSKEIQKTIQKFELFQFKMLNEEIIKNLKNNQKLLESFRRNILFYIRTNKNIFLFEKVSYKTHICVVLCIR